MRDLTARFANYRPLCLVCSDDFDDGSYSEYGDIDESSFYSADPIVVPPPILAPSASSLGIFGTVDSNSTLASFSGSSAIPAPGFSGAPSTSGTIIPAPGSSGGIGLTLIQSLERDAAQVTNNAIIENANPYNEALISNVPISTGPQVITAPKASHTALAIGLIVLAGLGGILVLRKA